MKHLFAATVFTVIASLACAATRYSTVGNGFAPFAGPDAMINDNCLVVENTALPHLVLADTIEPHVPYKFYARFANLHNREGKSYKVSATPKKVQNPACGLLFNNEWMVMVNGHNTDLNNEALDHRTLVVSLFHGNELVKQAHVDDGVDLYDGFNVLCVEVNDTVATISMGKHRLQEVMRAPCNAAASPLVVGLVAGLGAKMKVERAVLSHPDQNIALTPTPWTKEALDEHFAQSTNPFEGYWEYLDRDMDDTRLKMGGRYRLALVSNGDDSFDIIYVDGAQVKPHLWREGLLKGRMKKTIFTDHYSLYWVDATGEPITEDAYATFESGAILNLKFPVYKSQMRLSKSPLSH